MKHAILIMIHFNSDILLFNLEKLDDENIDFYIHIDKKAKVDKNIIINSCTKSKVFFVDNSIEVTWGSDSQIKCEILLFKLAIREGKYDFFHLISGNDLLICSKSDFFDNFKNVKQSCVDIDYKYSIQKKENRIKYYYVFQDKIGNKKTIKNRIYNMLQNIFIVIQKLFLVDRLRNVSITLEKGSNWLSLSNNDMVFLINEYPKYEKLFKNTLCADEMFVQTILCNNINIKSNINPNNYRFIDWKRGHPYVWKTSDINELMQSSCVFARKINDINIAMILERKGIYGKKV